MWNDTGNNSKLGWYGTRIETGAYPEMGWELGNKSGSRIETEANPELG